MNVLPVTVTKEPVVTTTGNAVWPSTAAMAGRAKATVEVR